ncbi:hypothetical protein ACWFRM_42960 [Streptomyces sp. NPDC055144]
MPEALRRLAVRLELPDYDFRLFDSCTLVRMHTDGTDTTVGIDSGGFIEQ